jgi:hypothetical protein
MTADVGSSYSTSKVPYSIDLGAILTTLGYPPNDPAPVAYGDFNGDGIPDVVFGDPSARRGSPSSLLVSPEVFTSTVLHK